MKASISIGFALWLSLANLLFTKAALLGSRASSPSPTRPFTVSAFESPDPIGQGITGYNLTARDGNLYLSPKPNVHKAVLYVNGYGSAFLDSTKRQAVYIDTYSGLLAYASPPPAGAIFVDFIHLGHGTTVFYQGDGFTSDAPGTFEWIGVQDNLGWFACGVTDGEYQVYKLVSNFGGTPDLDACTSIDLSALDYSGPSPAVDD